MIYFEKSFTTKRPLTDCFRFLEKPGNLPEWHDGISAIDPLNPGPLKDNFHFSVQARIGPLNLPLELAVTDRVEKRQLTFAGGAKGLSLIESFYFSAGRDGRHTQIRYVSQIKYTTEFEWVNPLLNKALRYLQDRTAKKLARIFSQQPLSSESKYTNSAKGSWSDKLVLPALLGFSSIGYNFRKKTFPSIDGTLDGKTILVTGASSGLGQSGCRRLADLGANLILVSRSQQKLNAELAHLEYQTGRKGFYAYPCDLSEPNEVYKLTATLSKDFSKLDGLVHNAGVLERAYRKNSQALEYSFAVNLLGPHILTKELYPLLKASKSARVIFVSSGGMYPVTLNVDALNDDPTRYEGIQSYAMAKRAQVILTEMLAKKYSTDNIVVHAMHPGWADTPGVMRSLPMFHRLTEPILRSPEQGADTFVWLLASSQPLGNTGKFWHDRRTRNPYLIPGKREPESERLKLWNLLENLSSSICA